MSTLGAHWADVPMCEAPGPEHRRHAPTDDPAVWAVTLAGVPCGCIPERIRLLCGPCLAALREAEVVEALVTCGRCGHDAPFPRQIVAVAPLSR